MRLFTDRHRERAASAAPEDVAEVLLCSLVVRRPRQFGACWVGCKLWEELGLGEFWQKALGEEVGAVAWEKVVELLAVNRLIAPRSELSIHEKWFPQTAMAALLENDERVAEKDRLYRAWTGSSSISKPWKNIWPCGGKTFSGRASMCCFTI